MKAETGAILRPLQRAVPGGSGGSGGSSSSTTITPVTVGGTSSQVKKENAKAKIRRYWSFI